MKHKTIHRLLAVVLSAGMIAAAIPGNAAATGPGQPEVQREAQKEAEKEAENQEEEATQKNPEHTGGQPEAEPAGESGEDQETDSPQIEPKAQEKALGAGWDDEAEDWIFIDEAHFPDSRFREYLTSICGMYLEKSDLHLIDSLNIGGKGIKNLQGIEYLTEIENLNCMQNELTDLDFMRYLPKLKTLNCSENRLTEVNLDSVPGLTEITCGNNRLTAIDFSNNTVLQKLNCGDNPSLTSIDVSNATALTELNSTFCGLTSVNVDGASSLTTLNLYDNSLLSLDLSRCNTLTSFNGGRQWPKITIPADEYDYVLDLAVMDPGMDISKFKISEGSSGGATLTGTKLSNIRDGYSIGGSYDCGQGKTLNIAIRPFKENTWVASLYIENWTYGEAPNAPDAGPSKGTAVYTYSDKADGVFTDTVPQTAGTWYVKATVEEYYGTGSAYTGLEDVASFTIAQAEPVYTIPAGLTAQCGQTLADVELPEGFSWKNDTISVGEAGTHNFEASFTPADTVNYKTVTVQLSVEVKKRTPSYTVPTSLSAVYGDTLADITLPEGFTWMDDSQSVGNAGDQTFQAKFTPADTDTYEIVENIDVAVKVEKADPSYSVPSGLTAVYGNTLADITLPEGFTWMDGGQSVGDAGDHDFPARYTPADTDNYLTVDNISVAVKVAKAVPVYQVPEGLIAVYGTTLAEVELPESFSWMDDSQDVGNVGAHDFQARFTPADTANYKTVDNIDITVTVKKLHTVTISDNGLGTALAAPAEAVEGTRVTLSATPDDGCRLKRWEVTKGNVTIQNNSFTMPDEEVEILAVFEEKPVITDDAGGVYEYTRGQDMTITCSGSLADLTGVYVDGKLVDAKYYTLKSGSTILTLKREYLATLSNGTHTLKLEYGDISAEMAFKVAGKPAAPGGSDGNGNGNAGGTEGKNTGSGQASGGVRTGDFASVAIPAGLLLLSAAACAVLILRKRRTAR